MFKKTPCLTNVLTIVQAPLLPASDLFATGLETAGLLGHRCIGTDTLDPACDSIASTCLTYSG